METKYLLIIIGIVILAAVAAVAVVVVSGIAGAGASLGPDMFDPSCVGVIDISGEIVSQDSQSGLFSEGSAGSLTIAETIKEADEDDNVKAMLFVIDSPGGSVVATKEIYDAMEKSEKPKVAYFRETAASGGYYVGAATDYIVSEPAALTGSIGVRATVTDLSPLFEKIGYNSTTFKSGVFKDIGDQSRPMTDDEKAIFQDIVDEIFQDFKTVVLKHRGDKINNAEIDKIFDARIMTGKQALYYGLVDKLGNKDDALSKAAELGGLKTTTDPNVCEFSNKKTNWWSELFASTAYGFSKGISGSFGSIRQTVKVSQ